LTERQIVAVLFVLLLPSPRVWCVRSGFLLCFVDNFPEVLVYEDHANLEFHSWWLVPSSLSKEWMEVEVFDMILEIGKGLGS
jgi:hypothetical protein